MMLVRDLAAGKLFGHPIHVMLVHFPAALLPVAAALEALRDFAHVSLVLDIRILLWPGVAMGWIAVVFGLWDLIRLPKASPEMMHALIHGGINATALSGFTWALYLSPTSAESTLRVVIELACTALILIGNKFGGDLIFRYAIGHLHTEIESKRYH